MGDDEPIDIEYKAKNGEMLVFDICAGALRPFGLSYDDTVNTPKGRARVIGVREGCIWFHCECDAGASYWDDGHSQADLERIGISLILPEIQPMVIDLTEKMGVYKLKRISYKDKLINIILQNENGPCPLISISNVLALRGDITISPAGDHDTSRSIDIDIIKSLLTELLDRRCANAKEDVKKQVQKAVDQLPNLQTGLDVNVGFQQPDSFDKTDQSLIFDLLGVRLVHGWLVDPIDVETHAVIGSNTYNDLMNKLVAIDTPPPTTNTQPLPPSSPTSVRPTDAPSSPKPIPPPSPQLTHPASPSQSQPAESASANETKKPDEVKPPTPRDFYEGEIITSFLHQTSSQLTAHGLAVLLQALKEDELCVFFRNNHFSTLTRHSNQLYILVTDIGYEKEHIIVWDLLNSVEGNLSIFVTGEFKATDDEKKDQVVNTLELMGYSRPRIEECYKSAPREKLVNADDAVSQHIPLKYAMYTLTHLDIVFGTNSGEVSTTSVKCD